MGFPAYPRQFQIYHYQFNLVARDTLLLPSYKGSTFRGGFGYSFQDLVCSEPYTPCERCGKWLQCLYTQVFNTPALGIMERRPKYKDAPRPFVIIPPLATTQEYAPGSELACELVLVGQAGALLPYFIRSFDRLGETGIGKKRGRYLLKNVQDCCDHGSVVFEKRIPQVTIGKPLTFEELVPACAVAKIRLSLLTPLRMIHEGKVCTQPSFELLIKNLLRRISMLNLYYGEKWEADFKDILAAAQNIECVERNTRLLDWERHSERKGAMKLGGVVGEMVFAGELTPFMPFLKMGEHLHIGKVTSMGLGAYTCEEMHHGCYEN